MKKLEPGRLCGCYLVSMGSLFLLAVSPKGYGNIVETKFAVLCFLTALLLLGFLVLAIQKALPRPGKWDAVRVMILLYWSWSLISALCSPWRGIAFLGADRSDGMITITLYCATALILSRYGESAGFPLWVPAAALALLCLVAILQFFDLNPFWLYPGELRWSGREREYNGAFLSLTGNADLTASVLCTGFGLLWPLGVRKMEPWLLLVSLLCLGVLLASGVRAGALGAAASVMISLPIVLKIGKKGRIALWAAFGLLCFAAALLIYLIPLSGTAGELRSLLHGHAEDSFGSGRIYIWKEAWKLVKERPLLGGGPDTLGERGLAFVKTAVDGTVIRRSIDCAHCEGLNILVNQGLPALVLIAGAVILTLARSIPCGGAAVSALRSALIAYLAASLFGIGMPANSAYFWLLWGLLIREIEKENGKSLI